jgi:hypothetical protein
MAGDGDSRRSNASLTYPASRLAAPIELVDLAREIEQADRVIGVVVHAKLEALRDQMRALQEQARRVLDEAQRDARLHRARCHFKKVPGSVYHLYRKGDGELYFSMLSPRDWSGAPPHAFEGSYRLEADMSWTAVDERGGDEPAADPRALVAELLDEGSRDG